MKRKFFLVLLVFAIAISITNFTTFASSLNQLEEFDLNETNTYVIRATPDKEINLNGMSIEEYKASQNIITHPTNGVIELETDTGIVTLYEVSEFDLNENFKTETPPLTRAQPFGWLDTVNTTTISGWAWDSDRPNTPINVRMYFNNQTINKSWYIEITADMYRQDLVNAGIGNGYHGFNFGMNWNILPAGFYEIEVYGMGGSNALLQGCPKTYTITNPVGTLYNVTNYTISGWAWRASAPNNPIDVRIYLNNQTTGQWFGPFTITADLFSAGIGNNYHGFSAEVIWGSFPTGSYSADVSGIGVYEDLTPLLFNLTNSPKPFSIYQVNNYWCVDSGKHLDWDGSTIYSTEWNTAVTKWNNYKSGVIRKDTILINQDVKIQDVPALSSGAVAQTSISPSSGKGTGVISFSTSVMNGLGPLYKQIVCTHEIGHALGLRDNGGDGTSTIMHGSINTTTSNGNLTNADKINYDYMYNNKY